MDCMEAAADAMSPGPDLQTDKLDGLQLHFLGALVNSSL